MSNSTRPIHIRHEDYEKIKASATARGVTLGDVVHEMVERPASPRGDDSAREIDRLKGEIKRARDLLSEAGCEGEDLETQATAARAEIERLKAETGGPSYHLPPDLETRIVGRARVKGISRNEAMTAVLVVGLKRIDALEKYAGKKTPAEPAATREHPAR
ncbi:MAG: hypothetical protein EKK62_04090 [Acidimicrobiia bacterium]|nr:MAG: hypothetical protein EKK62_04090 [Acidimicrobiia bacterium]